MLDEIFMTVPDHRVTGRCTYLLPDLLTIALLTYVCGGEDYVVKRKFGLDESAVLGRIEAGLLNEPYNNQVAVLMDALRAGGLRANDSQIEKLVLKMCQYGKEPTPDKLSDFIDKIKYTVELPNTPHYGAAMKLGRSATKEAMKIVDNIGAPELTEIQKQNIRELADALGIPRKEIKPMSFIDADQGASNPNDNTQNCQSVVVAFEARRRGLDCYALSYVGRVDSASYELGERFQDAWINPKNGKVIEPTIFRGKSDDEILTKLRKGCNANGRYVLGINYKDGRGHTVSIDRINGKILIKDEQLDDFYDITSLQDISYLELIRIDKAIFNIQKITSILGFNF